MNDWLAEQSRRNLEGRESWNSFAGHRQRVTDLLVEAASGRDRPSLCLLGAGNCNDLDLATLVQEYGQIHLIDFDAAAVSDGIERQGQTGQRSLVVRGGVDLLGLLPMPDAIPSADLVAAVANHRPLQDLAAYDVVASLCLLSQLIESATGPLKGDPASQVELVRAIRRRHLEQLVELLKPGGSGLLFTDLVSSETAPQILTLPDSQIAAFAADCIERRNFFTGLNPAVILDLLRNDPWIASRIVGPEPVGPWKWDFGPRSYVAYAIRFQRRTEY